MVLTFNPANLNMNKIINKHRHLVGKCTNREAFIEKSIVAHRRNKNLSDKLVSTRCKTTTSTNTKTHDRISKTTWNCKYCPKPSQPRNYKSPSTGREYTGPAKYTCKTKNGIHLITCKKCGKNTLEKHIDNSILE